MLRTGAQGLVVQSLALPNSPESKQVVSLQFVIYKMGMITLPTSKRGCEGKSANTSKMLRYEGDECHRKSYK